MNNTSLIQVPAYKIAEYMIVLTPHDDLRQRILNVKREFNNKYNITGPLSGKAHIALSSFKTYEMLEEKIVQKLQLIGMAAAPFKAELKDYGSFPTHTIFIQVVSKVAIELLSRELRTIRRLLKSPDNDPWFVNEPYISIARKLSPEIYDKAWLDYSHRHFTASFVADGMLLLKRPPGNRNFQIVKRFEFMNLPVMAKQGELF